MWEGVCCGERACPALGCEAPPIKKNAVYLTLLRAWFWGCFAPQRGASPLATTGPLAKVKVVKV